MFLFIENLIFNHLKSFFLFLVIVNKKIVHNFLVKVKQNNKQILNLEDFMILTLFGFKTSI